MDLCSVSRASLDDKRRSVKRRAEVEVNDSASLQRRILSRIAGHSVSGATFPGNRRILLGFSGKSTAVFLYIEYFKLKGVTSFN